MQNNLWMLGKPQAAARLSMDILKYLRQRQKRVSSTLHIQLRDENLNLRTFKRASGPETGQEVRALVNSRRPRRQDPLSVRTSCAEQFWHTAIRKF